MGNKRKEPRTEFGRVLKDYIESQGMTYVEFQRKLFPGCHTYCRGNTSQWIIGLGDKRGRSAVYPNSVALKRLSEVVPKEVFQKLWEAVPSKME